MYNAKVEGCRSRERPRLTLMTRSVVFCLKEESKFSQFGVRRYMKILSNEIRGRGCKDHDK